MLKVLRVELSKLLRLKKSLIVLAGVNILPLFFILVLSILILKGIFFHEAGWFALIMGDEIKKDLTSILLVETASFSFLWLFFSTLVIGEIISKDFSLKRIRLLFLKPVSRLEIFLGKLLAAIVFYLLCFAVFILLNAVMASLLQTVFSINIRYYLHMNEYIRILGVLTTISLSYISLVFLVATLTGSIEMTVGLTVFLLLCMLLFDFYVLLAFEIPSLMPEKARDFFARYSYTRTLAAAKTEGFISYIQGETKEIPVDSMQVLANILWSVFFLFLAFFFFARRQDAA